MCGIVGMVRSGWSPPANLTKAMSDLLYIDTVRGHCGTGIALVNPKNELAVYKKALPGYDFLRSLQWEHAERNLSNSRVIIGHNRASTIGSATDKNAHPFCYRGEDSEIVLVHNGTLQQYHSVSPARFTHEVDSAHAAAAIAHYGAEEALKKIKGWYVFVWYDVDRKTFNIARNQNRDIAWCYDKDGNMWYASEWEMLDYVLGRHNIELAPFKEGQEHAYTSMPDHSWCSWDLTKDKNDLSSYTLQEIKAAPEPTRFQAGYPHYGPAYGGFGRDDYEDAELIPWKPENTAQVATPSQAPSATVSARLNHAYKIDPKALISFCGMNWEPYAKPPEKGCIEGFLNHIPGMAEEFAGTEVVVHGVTEAEWAILESIKEDIPGHITTIANIGDRQHERLVVKIDQVAARELMAARFLEAEDEYAAITLLDEVPDTVVGPSGAPVSLRYFTGLVSGGCANCGDPIALADAEKLVWLDTSPVGVLCPTCACDKLPIMDLKDALKATRMIS